MKTAQYWAVVAVLVLAAVGLYGLSHGAPTQLAAPLDQVSMQVMDWRGQDVALSERIAAATGADTILNRAYVRDNDMLFLYVGFYKNQRTGDTIHSPKNCLPGGGWQPTTATTIPIRTPDGRNVPVNLYLIQKGTERQLVLYWYQSHGRIIASEYSAKIYMVLDALTMNRTDGALVRVSMPLGSDDGVATDRAVVFAQALLPQLDKIFPR